MPVLLLLIGLMGMSFLFYRARLSEQRAVLGNLDEQRAFCLAEAGLHEAFESARSGNSGAVGSQAQPAQLGGGMLWVDATPLTDDRTRLVSTALVGSGRQALEAVIHVDPDKPPLFVATLNSKDNLTLNADVMIDSFDSELGTYASQVVNTDHGYSYANDNGDARSNADIVLNARSTTFGDAIPGPGHGVSFATDAYVSGSTDPAPEPFVFPDIDLPAFTPLGNFAVPTAGTASLGPGNYDYGTFAINKDATLTVTGPATIVVDSFAGGKTGHLMIDASAGPVTFYVRGAYSHLAGFEADSVAGSPMALAFLVNGDSDVVFPANTKIRGAYYAPNANILFASGNECWGAFAANRIDMSNTMHFHFDETLMRYWSGEGGDGGDRLEVLSWCRTAVLPNSLVLDRRDPLQVLGLSRSDLLSPADSWVTE